METFARERCMKDPHIRDVSSSPTTAASELRVDPLLGTRVHVVGSRQARPNLPSGRCPFCVGGLEAPEPYVVRWIPNRWPALNDDRCEVVLYSSQHDATLWSLGSADALRVVDLWAARTQELGARDDVDYVLIFENRGAEVGATISHPHGQIYAYDHVPPRQYRRLSAGWAPDQDPGDRTIVERDGWRAWVPYAPIFPLAVEVAPLERVPDLTSLDHSSRQAFAGILVDVLARIDRAYQAAVPYMMWLNQRPTVGEGFGNSWFNVEIVSPWRATGVLRYIAAAELASDEYFNPVVPEDLAELLRR